MLRSMILLLFALTATALVGNEPFVVYQGSASIVPKQPQAFVSTDGIVHLTFGTGNQVFYCNNSDQIFGIPEVAFEVPNLSLGMRRGPRIAVTAKTIVITAIGGPLGKGKDGDVFAYRSEDSGRSWLGPVHVNDVEASAREGLHAMTVSEKGVLWCVWLDLRSKRTELYASQSVDFGETWTKNQLVYRSPDGSICECCHPSIVSNGDSIHILFRNSKAGNRDMYLVSSDDQGKTFGEAKQLGNKNWQLNNCPMDGGMLAVTATGNITSVWRRGGAIYSTERNLNTEELLGSGEQPWIASNSSGTYIAWMSAREGDLLLSSPASNRSTTESIAENARDPIVVAGKNAKAPAYLFWEERNDNQFSIMGKQVR